MKILHTADIHLRGEDDRRYEALRRVIELAGEESVDLLVISGDLFDRDVDADSLRPAIRSLFSGVDFRIALIRGNHDSNSYGSGLHFGDNIDIIDDPDTPLVIGEARVWGMPFEDISSENIARRLNALAERLDEEKTDILLYHGELLDSFYSRKDFGEEGDYRYMPVKLSYFDRLKLDYVLAGHFHTSFRVRRLEQGGYFVYPGSPVSITRREEGRRHVNIFSTGEEPKEYPLDTPYFERVDLVLDPFRGEDPVEKVKRALESVPPEAETLLTVSGYIRGEKGGITEKSLVERIEEIGEGRIADGNYLFRDIGTLLNSGIYRSFESRLSEKDFDEETADRVREAAIRAMMEAGI